MKTFFPAQRRSAQLLSILLPLAVFSDANFTFNYDKKFYGLFAMLCFCYIASRWCNA